MKNNLSLIIGATLLATVAGSFAQTAVTDPVGYITHAVNPAVSATIPSVTLLAATLVNKVDYAGVTTNDASGSTNVQLAGIVAGLDGTSYLEIKSGANEGWWTTIASSAAGSITTVDQLPAGSGIGTNVVVRKHMTLGGFMGANAANLTTGASPDVADEVQILDSHLTPQAIRTYFYAGANEGVTPGWYNPGGEPSDGVVILPGTAVQVVRKSTTGSSLVSVGHVKTTKTQIDIYGGTNWVSPMRATGVTLLASAIDSGNLSTGVQRGTSTADADEIQFLLAPAGGSQAISTFFAADPAQTGGITGWFNPGGDPSDTKLIPESEGVILSRKSSTQATLTVPAVTIAQ